MAQTYKIKWTRSSANELDDILAYLADKSIQGLETFRAALRDTLDRLSVLPFSGAVFEKSPADEVRELLVGSYRVFYRVLERPKRIQLMHLRHVARQDPQLSELT